ncbi:MAG: hypothetical protein DSY89_06725 [Deltaproteobacteria bacterium]|nr:MAG: hypothetical protein DSY89_06725 [Deltaproteobacteria bacterium]
MYPVGRKIKFFPSISVLRIRCRARTVIACSPHFFQSITSKYYMLFYLYILLDKGCFVQYIPKVVKKW